MDWAISIVIDKDGLIRENLIGFNTLYELDMYTSKFNSSDEIRSLYNQEIEVFKEKYYHHIIASPKKNNGRIVITTTDPFLKTIPSVPIIYQNEKDLLQLDSKIFVDGNSLLDVNCYNEMLLANIFMKKIVLLLNKEKILKKFLERKDIIDGFKLRMPDSEKKYFDTFIELLTMRIKDSNNGYYIARRIFYVLTDIEKELKIFEDEVINKFNGTSSEDSADEYFLILLARGDWEEIHRLYSLEYIAKHCPDIYNMNDLGDNRKK